MMYSVMAGGSALAIYFTQLLWDNVQLILFNYQTYVFWYIIVTGFISFVICYRFGPPKNKRSKNLIKWGLQMVSMGMIYFSSQFQEASVGVILLTVGIYYFPAEWLYLARKYWYNGNEIRFFVFCHLTRHFCVILGNAVSLQSANFYQTKNTTNKQQERQRKLWKS